MANVLGFLAVSLSITCGSECYSDGDTVSVATVLESLRASEQRIKVAEWRCDMTITTLSDPADVDANKQLPSQAHSFVRIAPHEGHYLANIDAISPWQDGAASFMGV